MHSDQYAGSVAQKFKSETCAVVQSNAWFESYPGEHYSSSNQQESPLSYQVVKQDDERDTPSVAQVFVVAGFVLNESSPFRLGDLEARRLSPKRHIVLFCVNLVCAVSIPGV